MADDYITSDIGHGALGLRDNLRPFSEIGAESGAQPQVFVDLRLAKVVVGWSLDSSNTYRVVMQQVFDGILRDVVEVQTSSEYLTRVETLAACQGTPGTYFFDPDQAQGSSLRWDDGVTVWDGGVLTWDNYPFLYVHLTGNADPAILDVVVRFGFYYGSARVVQPSLGADLLSDGEFDNWNSSTDLVSWTETLSGAGWTVNRESAVVKSGTYSVKLNSTGAASGSAEILEDKATVAAKVYCLSGYYMTPAQVAGLNARLYVGTTGGSFLYGDGRSFDASGGVTLTPTNGLWRRCAFLFVAPASTTRVKLRLEAASALAGVVYFDGFSLRRVFRWNTYEPAIAAGSVPGSEVARQGLYFDPWTVGLGSLTLLNGGLLESLFGGYDSIGQPVAVRYGGRFPGGNEVLFDDCALGYGAVAKQPQVDETHASFDLEDVRTNFKTKLPVRNYDRISYPSIIDRDYGRPIPLIFGTVKSVRPALVEKLPAAGGFVSRYHVVDGSYSVGSFSLTTLWAYTDEDAANKQSTDRRIATNDHTGIAASTGLTDVLIPLRVFEIVAGKNDRLDFDTGGGALVGAVAPGLYFADGGSGIPKLTNAIQQALVNAGGAGFSVTFDAVTFKFTVSKSSGTFNVRLTSSAANRDRSAWRTIGFTGDTDKTGALSYVADDAVFSDPETQQYVRFDVGGYKDDVAGTYTGTANARIELASDILRFLLVRVLKVNPSRIDAASFLAARSGGPQPLSIYLGNLENGNSADTALTIDEVIRRLEASIGADFSIDGETFLFKLRTTGAPADVVDLYDRDFLSFASTLLADDAFSVVRLFYGLDPVIGSWKSSQLTASTSELRYGRPRAKEIYTWLSSLTDVQNRLSALSAAAAVAPARYVFRVKGQILRKLVGDKVRITRTRGLSSTGALSAQLVRLLQKKDDFTTFESDVVAFADS